MTKKEWLKVIKTDMEAVGVYKQAFDPAVNTLADILEQRDNAYKEFLSSGGDMVVKTVSDRGAENYRKNPRMQVWNDLNAQALSFWRDLGLTAAGLKRIDDEAMKKKKQSALAAAMKALG